MAVLSFALLMWAEAASAQDPPKTYSVSVSVHKSLEQLSGADVKEILDKASKMLQKSPSHVDAPDNVKCPVAFTLKGPIRFFDSSDTPAVVNKEHIDAVHGEGSYVDADFHVKVVDKITNFCRFPGGGFRGCAFPPNFRSIIVEHPKRHLGAGGQSLEHFPDHLLWAHEFGHLTGLGHVDWPRALMTSCALDKEFPVDVPDTQVLVNQNECTCLLSGPGFGPNGTCGIPGPVACPR